MSKAQIFQVLVDYYKDCWVFTVSWEATGEF